jgi:hypothetical protein
MLDTRGRVVGMLVGGSTTLGDIVTPMDAILANADWKGLLTVLPTLPGDVVSPFDPRSAVGATLLPVIGHRAAANS